MLVLGNGESRKEIDLSTATDIKIGCNAIYRDHRVQHLVCCDRRMVAEACSSGYNTLSYIYTRSDWIHYFANQERVRSLPPLPYQGENRWDDPFHWGSGPYAVLLGAKICKGETITLIGFDLYGIENKVNNIYKGTQNYADIESKNVDPKYWIYQIGRIFSLYKSRRFRVLQTSDWPLPDAWNQPNVELDNISNFTYT
jgi:hypothetical protein